MGNSLAPILGSIFGGGAGAAGALALLGGGGGGGGPTVTQRNEQNTMVSVATTIGSPAPSYRPGQNDYTATYSGAMSAPGPAFNPDDYSGLPTLSAFPVSAGPYSAGIDPQLEHIGQGLGETIKAVGKVAAFGLAAYLGIVVMRKAVA